MSRLRQIDVWLVVILLLALLLRLYQPGLYPTTLDELLMTDSAIQLARHSQWTWLGNPTSFAPLPAHSPLTVYLTALPLLFSPDWILPRLLVGLGGVIAVLGTYLLVQRYSGQYAALVGAALLAVMPVAVDWSRFVWNPNFAPPFIVFWLYTGLLGYHEGKTQAQIAHWLLLSAVIQTDAAYIIFTPLSILLLIHHFWQTPSQTSLILRTTLIAFLLTVTSLIPMLIGNIGVRQGIFSYAIHIVPERDTRLHLQVPDWNQAIGYFGLLTASANFRPALHLSEYAAWWWPHIWLHMLFWIQCGIVTAGMGWALVYGLRRHEAFPMLWLTVVALWSFLFLFIDSGRIVPLYFLLATTYAAVPMFALVCARLWNLHRLLGLVAFLFIAGHLWLTMAHLHWYQQNDTLLSLREAQIIGAEKAANHEPITLPAISQDTPVNELEWYLRWRILAEQYPLQFVCDAPEASQISTSNSCLSLMND